MALVDPAALVCETCPNFRWREFSGWAVADAAQVYRGRALVGEIMQPARDALGRIDVSAGGWIQGRLGDMRTGVHRSGAALDFVPAEATVREAYEWIRDHVAYGEVIEERDHVHVTLPGWGGYLQALYEPTEGVYEVDPEAPVKLGLTYEPRGALAWGWAIALGAGVALALRGPK